MRTNFQEINMNECRFAKEKHKISGDSAQNMANSETCFSQLPPFAGLPCF